jgi:hypothetical protein
MRKKLTLMLKQILCAGLLFLFPPMHQALHANSGNLFYRHLGDDRYEITLHYYKDCTGGIPYATSYTGYVRGACGSRNFTLTRDSVWDVSQSCLANQTCNSINAVSGFMSIQRYRAVINFQDSLYSQFLGSGCCELTLGVSLRPRGSQYTNMSVSGVNLVLQVGLSICRKPGMPPHNSSSLQIFPWQIHHTQNQPAYHSFRALDPDGDSLSYELTPCLSSGTSVTYNASFKYDYPLSVYCGGAQSPCAANPKTNPPRGFYLDAQTGDLVFQPTSSTEISAVAVRIKEYRRDSSGSYTLIGYSMVEGYIVTRLTNNNHPLISHPLNENICEKERYCFTSTYSDAKNPGQAVPDTPLFRYFTNIPNYSLVNIPPDRFNPANTVNVCFTPPAFDSIKEPYFFTMAVFDNFCGYAFEAKRTHRFQVRRKPASSLTGTVLPGSRLVVEARAQDSLARMDLRITGPKAYRLERFNLRKLHLDTLRLFAAGDYRLELTTYGNGYCEFVIRDTIRMSGCLTLHHQIDTQKNYCRNQPAVFKVNTQNSIGALQYRWSNRFGTTVSQADTVHIRLISDTLLRLRVDDQFGCFVQDSFRFRTYLPEAGWQVPANGICSENNGPEIENWLQFNSQYPGNWQAGSGILTQSAGRWYLNNRLPVQGDSTLALQYTILDSLGCPSVGEIFFPVRFTRRVQIRDTSLCRENGSFDVRQLLGSSDTRYMALQWICSNPGTLTPAQVLNGTNFIALLPGTYGFTLKHNDTIRQCAAEESFQITRRGVPDYRILLTNPLCDNGDAIDIKRFVEVFTPSPSFTWQLLSVNNAKPDSKQLSTLIGTSFRPYHQGVWRIGFTESSTGCLLKDSIQFTVIASPRPNLGNDTSIAPGTGIRLNAGAYATFLWDDNSTIQFRDIHASELTTTPRMFWVKVNNGITACFGYDTVLLSLKMPESVQLPGIESNAVFPNPFTNHIRIRTQNRLSVQLFTADGRKIEVPAAFENGHMILETTDLPAGMYILALQNGIRIKMIRNP